MFLIIDNNKFCCIVPGCGRCIFEEVLIKDETIYACMNCLEWYRPHPESVVELVDVLEYKQRKDTKSDEKHRTN